jgi:hypothetical protein
VQFRFLIVVVCWLSFSAAMFGFALPAAAQQQPPGAPGAGPPVPPPPPGPAATEPPAVPLVTPTPEPGQPSASPSPTGRRLDAYRVTAKRIAFYSNRYILRADGDVNVTLGDGTRVVGNAFYNDLRLNRFVVAGNVTIQAPGQHPVHGAAFAEYLDFDRGYFVPILSEPDRWTFTGGDYEHPLLGREMPGDTFYLPDLSGESVFCYSSRAVVDPRQSVRFAPARINFGLVFVPFPSYFLNYSPNPNFAQNALNGAFADGPLDFAGGEHALATAHVRYDSVDHLFAAYEEHQVSDNHYFVASINPLTRPFKQYNFLAYDRISPGLQVTATFQESAFQHGFSQPLSATAFLELQVTGSLPHSYLQLTDYQFYDSLLAAPSTVSSGGRPYYGDPTHPWIPDHPSNVQLAWLGFRHQVYDLPLTYQLRSSFGAVNNTDTPLQQFGGTNFTKEYDKAVGFNLASKSLTVLRDPTGQRRDLYFTASLDKQREWYSAPHHIDNTNFTASFTKIFDPEVTFVATYNNLNTGDFYGAQQDLAYPGNATYYNPFTGLTYDVSPGFRGFATYRAFIQQLVLTPSRSLTFNLTMRESRDFPRPLVGPLQLTGDTVNFVNYGNPPLEADFDVRFPITRVLVLDVSRSYYFNFGGTERWSPQFRFEIQK